MKFKNRIIVIFIVVSMFLIMSVQTVFAAENNSDKNWINISSVKELDDIRDNLEGNYRLVNNIDLTGVNWIPIGDSNNAFTGEFDGNGNEITNLTINSSNSRVGLFGNTDGANITNLILKNPNVKSTGFNVGSLTGYGLNTTITNIKVDGGTVEGKNSTGGLIGYISNSVLNDVYVTSKINGSGNGRGGLVGSLSSSSLSNAYSKGDVNGTNYIGGLVGISQRGSTINNAYATGKVKGDERVGGLVGNNNNTSISNAYATGSVTGTIYVGGLLGVHENNSSADNVFALNNSVIAFGMEDFGKLIGLCKDSSVDETYAFSGMSGGGHSNYLTSTITSAQFYQQSTYSNFDFDKIWDIDEGVTFPYLREVNISPGDVVVPDPGESDSSNDDNNDSNSSSDENIDFELISGNLVLNTSSPLSFGKIKLPTSIQTYSTSFEDSFNVKDQRGINEGWRLDVSATPFSIVEPEGGFKQGTSQYKLPVGSLMLSPIENISRVGTSSGGLPTSNLKSNTIIDDGIVTIASATADDSKGEFNLKFPSNSLHLTVDPSSIKMDTINYPDGGTPYEATITWDLVSAP